MANDDDDDRYNNEKRENSVRHVKMAVAKNKPNSPLSQSGVILIISTGAKKKKKKRMEPGISRR
jgi:hypothetical protein